MFCNINTTTVRTIHVPVQLVRVIQSSRVEVCQRRTVNVRVWRHTLTLNTLDHNSNTLFICVIILVFHVLYM